MKQIVRKYNRCWYFVYCLGIFYYCGFNFSMEIEKLNLKFNYQVILKILSLNLSCELVYEVDIVRLFLIGYIVYMVVCNVDNNNMIIF